MPILHYHHTSYYNNSTLNTSNLPPPHFVSNSTLPLLNTLNFSNPLSTPTLKSTFFGLKNQPIRNPNFHSFRRPTSKIKASSNSDYYSKLNLTRNATLQEIKNSYRKLARQYHPDMNKTPGSEDKFKEISAAYEILSDDEKRSLYDRFGEAGLQGEFDRPGFGSEGVDPFDVFDSIFGEPEGFFGSSNLRNKRNQSLDIRYDLYLSFDESIFGGKKDIQVTCFETCDDCEGTGAKSANCIKSCTECGGRGGVMKTQRTPFGVMSQVSTCSRCGGDGKIISDNCLRCRGQGKVQMKRNITIVIPPGVNEGANMQIQGEGNLDKRRGISGNLYLFVHIEEKVGVRRDGLNLYSRISIDYSEAILGTIVKVETVEGLRDLQIPPGTQPGDTIKLTSMGIPNIKKPSVRGDHHFVVNVEIPKAISDEERVLVQELCTLKALRKAHSRPSNGTFKADINEENVKSEPNNTSSKGAKKATSVFHSIRNFLGKKQSRTRFATVGLEASASSCNYYTKPDQTLLVSFSVVFAISCICALMGRINYFQFLRQRNGRIQQKPHQDIVNCQMHPERISASADK